MIGADYLHSQRAIEEFDVFGRSKATEFGYRIEASDKIHLRIALRLGSSVRWQMRDNNNNTGLGVRRPWAQLVLIILCTRE